MTFLEALEHLIQGKKISTTYWWCDTYLVKSPTHQYQIRLVREGTPEEENWTPSPYQLRREQWILHDWPNSPDLP